MSDDEVMFNKIILAIDSFTFLRYRKKCDAFMTVTKRFLSAQTGALTSYV
jgi:hypothetical protein